MRKELTPTLLFNYNRFKDGFVYAEVHVFKVTSL